jgi:hypothetical protein
VLTKAVENLKLALEPLPRSERKVRSRELVDDYAAPAQLSPSTDASPSKSATLALPDESPSVDASPITHDNPKPIQHERAGKYRKGDSRINHNFFDEELCGIEPLAQLLYFHLNRYREGTSNLTVVLTWSKLAERIPVSESTLRRAFAHLQKHKLATKAREVFGKGGAQGIVFRVVTHESPSIHASPSTGDTHKSKELKEHTQTTETPAAGVRVSSRFSLEECKRYADHLSKSGQGITNPGGYATKIYRSGEADTLIEKFLNPVPVSDKSKCPDCGGKGYYFPDPLKPETKRCLHERLHTKI